MAVRVPTAYQTGPDNEVRSVIAPETVAAPPDRWLLAPETVAEQHDQDNDDDTDGM
ncbi:hypothetical protein [Dactylosporangium sp. CA-092794]|uniref:hypothetical protein n=1 Tax=Dactylosporangium sp. CA-092794 TaxID=3239929 RepID=UPI003D92F6BC